MNRALLAVLLVAACSHSAPKAVPTPTPTVSPTPSPTASPTPSPTASPTPAAAALPGPVGTAVPAGFAARSATFVSDRTGWVLGTAAGKVVVARTRDGGATWRAFPGPETAGDDVARVRFANLRDGFVTGTRLWVTHDGGSTWKAEATADVTSLEAAKGRAWLLRNGTVTSRPVAGGPSTTELTGVEAAQVVVHSDLAVVADRGTDTLRLLHHGAAPTQVKAPCYDGDEAVVATRDATHWLLVCVGEPGAGHADKSSWRTSDAGAHWVQTGDPRGVNGTLLAVTTTDDFVFDHEGVVVSEDDDRTWLPLQELEGIVDGGFATDRLGFVVAQDQLLLSHGGEFRRALG